MVKQTSDNKRPLTEQEKAILEEAAWMFPVNEETGVFWVNADHPESVFLPVSENVEEEVIINGKIGDQTESFWLGYGPQSNTLVICKAVERWERGKGYLRRV